MFTQLFLAPDHLLLVRSNRFEERYQRFYFKDVQALVVTGLPSRTWLQAAMGVLAGAIFLLALTLVPNPAWRAVLGMLGVFPAVIGLVDYFRGERCRMILKTAVSNEPLPPVSRMPIARSVIARLKPLVEQQQLGEWNPEMVPASGPPVLAPAPMVVAPANRLMLGLLALLSIDALILLGVRLTHRNELLVVLVYSVATEIILAITALRRRGGDPRWVLYSLAGVALACAAVDLVGGAGLLVFYGWSLNDARVHGTIGTTKPMEMFYPNALIWWALGWRAAVAAAGWLSLSFKIEAAPETPEGKIEQAPDEREGDTPSLLQ